MTDLTIRVARPADDWAVARLAALDSAAKPAGDVLLAEVDGTPVAALSVTDGHAVADPFRHSDEAVALMRLRARRAAGAGAGMPARRRLAWPRLVSG
jgi:hypothetical protein